MFDGADQPLAAELAEIGVILLLFTLGLEYTAPELVSTLRRSAPLGAVDLVLNACSSIGELCARVQPDIPQSIVRVDARMAREAVSRGTRIAAAS